MIKRYFLTAIIIFSLLVSFILPASIAAEPANGNPARLIVTFDESARQTVKDFMQKKGGQVIRDFTIIPGMSISLGSEQIPGLMSVKGVKQVGIDGRVYASEAELDNSWGVKRIGAGSVSSYDKGSGVKIAIIDTGIDNTHPDLTANYVGGYDFVNNDDDPADDNGHGTHVAGIVAAADNDIGVVGVAPEASLYAYKVLDSSGSGYWSDIIAALQLAVNDDVQVVNMSLGSKSDAAGLHDAVIAAYNAGIVIVAAAGNSGNASGRTDSIEYPARYSEVISVGATSQSDVRAKFSSTGNLLELVAPGVGIFSTVPGGYASYSGTSMASPHVAGTAALIIASGIVNNNEVRQKLQNTADDLGTIGKDSQYGYGLINAYKAVPSALANGIINGVITDGTNAIANASVTDGTRTAVSGINGSYEIKNVPDGDYTVTASANNYISSSQQVTVTNGGTAAADFNLSPVTQSVMHVEYISMSSTLNGPNYFIYTEVKVLDSNSNPVPGATVYINTTLPDYSTVSTSGQTDTSGVVTLKFKSKPTGSYISTVTDVTKDGWTYDSPANIETTDSMTIP